MNNTNNETIKMNELTETELETLAGGLTLAKVSKLSGVSLRGGDGLAASGTAGTFSVCHVDGTDDGDGSLGSTTLLTRSL
jgi:hypothetical protein